MTLATYIKVDEDSLVCDLAETYHILNYRELPLPLLATLTNGLSEDSRIVKKIQNRKADTDTILSASILDGINLLVWSKTEDARNGTNRPKSVADKILNIEETSDTQIFSSVEEFENARQRALGGGD